MWSSQNHKQQCELVKLSTNNVSWPSHQSSENDMSNFRVAMRKSQIVKRQCELVKPSGEQCDLAKSSGGNANLSNPPSTIPSAMWTGQTVGRQGDLVKSSGGNAKLPLHQAVMWTNQTLRRQCEFVALQTCHTLNMCCWLKKNLKLLLKMKYVCL